MREWQASKMSAAIWRIGSQAWVQMPDVVLLFERGHCASGGQTLEVVRLADDHRGGSFQAVEVTLDVRASLERIQQ